MKRAFLPSNKELSPTGYLKIESRQKPTSHLRHKIFKHERRNMPFFLK
ncbi:hypothetical protein POREN0001_0386 [Porphyromonas endodontalis ATCC 35406]|uniref:Uncharacterized protein n=1 Tax=Porphyromonas endodontalis (strain ATCC 35406 / DSM 24491 / JCM 8526 / CCUG 16442 / BCRC 14492 / NCTC 13058 / HG 370) TaxID=553175 RepID=C3JAZ4_POREA|nr:hypothetical protein POREN0001_0386 [Porphyromonas endodontalis ATCC 35406]